MIPFQFTSCGLFKEGYAEVSLDHDMYGFIDKTGEFVIPPTYYQLKNFNEGLAAFRLKTADKWRFINPDNKVIIKTKFQSVNDFSEGISAVKLKDSYGYIDKQGKWIVKNIFSTADSFSNGLGLVTYKGGGYLNRSDVWVYKPHNFNR
ncbi:WG repeat-containing protein [Paenibacillus dauci]|uniref:WG repeat-containing protein n=1 Tax=Paenibacillus dauci TaxID=1567106 RepID=UPI000697DD4C|nr:WG repeat-containing protein [Paenibacillus dauci]